MCGIVGAITKNNAVPILLEGLKRLEYRGYDSAGIAVINNNKQIRRIRKKGKVAELAKALHNKSFSGQTGIAHTRWATHGIPSERNAHPHMSHKKIALVHNGIIENYAVLRSMLKKAGYKFTSETDSEVIAHLIHKNYLATNDFLTAVRQTITKLTGAYALAIICNSEPGRIIAARSGSPLVIGLGNEEYFVASDYLALVPAAQKFIYLEEGDIADITNQGITIYGPNNKKVTRKIHTNIINNNTVGRGKYKHYMQKEIFEQPEAVEHTLEECINKMPYLKNAFTNIKQIQIVACGTSFHAGLIAKYWLEEIARIPCQVEVASEIRYRKTVVRPNTLFIAISQSGETADTLAALRQAKKLGYKNTLAICNVPQSSLVREADFVLFTKAGPEIGVASTKAFTTQLTVLLMLTVTISLSSRGLTAGSRFPAFAGNDDEKLQKNKLIQHVKQLPKLLKKTLTLDNKIKVLAEQFADKQHAFFLGRGIQYPVAMEGALKLKEISYIHAESYPAGELKHGPIALIDKEMPVIVVAPNNELLEKLISNIQEVRARGGKLFVFADSSVAISKTDNLTIIKMPKVPHEIVPIIYSVPLQLLAYHVALLKGTDVDQPRNLAKSVTVE